MKVLGAAFKWQTTVKGGRALGAALSKVLHLRDGGITSRWYTATMSYGKFVVRLQRSGGWAYVVKYLKACSVLTQQAAGGQRIEATQALGCAVSRTRGLGIPRVIPAVMRKAISSGDSWTIRIWLTFFGLYRVIDIPGKLKLESITRPTSMSPDFLYGWVTFLRDFTPYFFREVSMEKSANLWIRGRSLGVIRGVAFDSDAGLISFVASLAATFLPKDWKGIPCDLKPKLLALFKSGPNSGGVHGVSWVDGSKPRSRKVNGKLVETTFTGTNTSAIFTDCYQWCQYNSDLYLLLKEWLNTVDGRAIRKIIHVGMDVTRWCRGQHILNPQFNPFKYPGFGRPKGLGKLGYKVEPAGKIRVFAMVDSLTQCVMKPLHDLLFSILRKLDMDGTFDQIRPAQRLINIGHIKFWSLDLSSATDRFPLALQQAMMSIIIGGRLAELWARLLIERDYLTPRAPKGVEGPPGDTPLRYGAGQPMGALTSWAAFSLCHHFLVQYAAYRALGVLGVFKDYALLGDDIVLANAQVALSYQALLLEIGVEYGLAKSLISSTGGFEFAKRTFSKGKDVSAISLLALGSAKADHSVLESVLTRFGAQDDLWVTLRRSAKILGYGYKAIARLPAVLSTKSRLQGLAILLSRPNSPWGLSVIEWLLQASPGLKMEVPIEVLQAIGERLWDSLKSKTENALRLHQEGLSKVLNPDSTYGGNVDVWFDKSSLHEHSWNVYVVVPLIAELKIELRSLREDLLALERPTLDDLNQIWLRIEEIRDGLAAIPTVPNFFERTRDEFGGAKRSALISTYRSVRSWLADELSRKLSNRCLEIKSMAMVEAEGSLIEVENNQPDPDVFVRPEGLIIDGSAEFDWGIHPSLLKKSADKGSEPDDSDANPGRDSGNVRPPQIIVDFNALGELRLNILDKPELPATYRVTLESGEVINFMENDIHLDGIFAREDAPYTLALPLLDEKAKARVIKRLREEQYDELY